MKKHILLIDDDKAELIAFLKALKLTTASFKCTYAKNASHATELLRYLNPDYIFFDAHLESAETHRMIQTIHNKRALLGCRYFLYTREITAELKRRAVELGAAGCIIKTAITAALADMLSVALGERKDLPQPSIAGYPIPQGQQSNAV